MAEPADRWADGAGHEDSRSVEALLDIGRASGDRQDGYRAEDLANEFGLTAEALDFYESHGILRPGRRDPAARYSVRDRNRLRVVLLAKALGFSLSEAKRLARHYAGRRGTGDAA
jgi:hypothetical protein